MKSLVSTVILCYMAIATAEAQDVVSNIRVQVADDHLIVLYDLTEMADIEAYVSFDGGATFRGPLQQVFGSIGKEIPPENDKMFMWQAVSELGGSVDHANAVIKLVANNVVYSDITLSETDALISVGRTVYRWDKDMNQTDFNRFMDLKVYKGMTPLSRNNTQILLARSSQYALSTYNRGLQSHNAGNLFLITGLFPGIWLKSQGSMYIREAIYMHNQSLDQIDVSQLMINYNFEKGRKRNRIGNAFLIPGALIAVGGAALAIYDGPLWFQNSDNYSDYAWVAGIASLPIGGAMMLVGITFKVNGKHLKRHALDMRYNGGMVTSIELDFGLTGNGAGLALKF